MKDTLIVLSGGLDSTTMLYEYQYRIGMAVSFHYGSNHNDRELEFAKLHCERLGIPHLVIRLPFIKQFFKSSLLEGADAIPEGNYDEENMKSTVVPFRNGIMLAVAAGFAESRKLDRIILGNHAGDHFIYPDCRPQFISCISGAIWEGTGAHIRVESPFCNLTKAEIVEIGSRLAVPFKMTYSCYKGGKKHCGKCGTCVERKEAFELAGVPDPTVYENGEK